MNRTPQQIQAAFERLRKNAFPHKLVPVADRIEKLKKLRAIILRRQTDLHAALYSDYRKAPSEIDLSEVFPAISELNDAIGHLKRWSKPKRVRTPLALLGSCSRVHYEPKGVVLIIGPWNYPFSLITNPLVSAVAAGNRAILKPSELTPATSKLLCEITAEVFSEDEVAIFEGDATVSKTLLELPFDHIFFTGSTRVGKLVAEAAAKNLASTTLELGGKSPAIVAADCNLAESAKRIAWGKFFNAGQTCIAPDYVLVEKSIEEKFLTELKKASEKFYGENASARAATKDFCRIITDGHFTRLKGLLDKSVGQGAKLVFGGENDASQRFLAPTILGGVKKEHAIMSEEIFGPVLPVMPYSSLDEACAFVRAGDKPLSLYVFTGSSAVREQVLNTTTSGGACVNNALIHFSNPHLPFGGVGASGIGNYHGEYGFRTFSHEKAVLRQGIFNTPGLMYPPYTATVRKMIALTLKFFSCFL